MPFFGLVVALLLGTERSLNALSLLLSLIILLLCCNSPSSDLLYIHLFDVLIITSILTTQRSNGRANLETS